MGPGRYFLHDFFTARELADLEPVVEKPDRPPRRRRR